MPISQHRGAVQRHPAAPGLGTAAPPQLLVAPAGPYRARRGRGNPSLLPSFPPQEVLSLPPKQLLHTKLVGWNLEFIPQSWPSGKPAGTLLLAGSTDPQRSPCCSLPIGRAAGRERREAEGELPTAGRHRASAYTRRTADRGCWGIVIIVLQRRVLPAGGGVEGGEERGREKVRGEHAAGLGPAQRRCWRARAEALRGAACPSSLGGTGGRSEAGTDSRVGKADS